MTTDDDDDNIEYFELNQDLSYYDDKGLIFKKGAGIDEALIHLYHWPPLENIPSSHFLLVRMRKLAKLMEPRLEVDEIDNQDFVENLRELLMIRTPEETSKPMVVEKLIKHVFIIIKLLLVNYPY